MCNNCQIQKTENLKYFRNVDCVVTNHDKVLALVVQKMDSAIHRINHYPVDSGLFCQHLSTGLQFIRWIALSTL